MNNKPLAGLALVILLAMPLSALAEATAGEAVWTPPVVTAEEMEAARLGERIVMRGQEGDDVRLVQQRLYLLSNYPREGYLRMREKFADRFGELFDGGVISYACHLVKPEKAIYEKLIADCGLDPAHTLFIDDTLPNVEAAMKMGINGFHMHEKGMMDRFFL